MAVANDAAPFPTRCPSSSARPSSTSRKRFGDWEGDLVIGAGQQQALVTLNERKSRYSLIAHVPFKTAQAVSDAMISLLTPFAACVHTLTTDNGKEFAQHERIAGNSMPISSSLIPMPPGNAAPTRT